MEGVRDYLGKLQRSAQQPLNLEDNAIRPDGTECLAGIAAIRCYQGSYVSSYYSILLYMCRHTTMCPYTVHGGHAA